MNRNETIASIREQLRKLFSAEKFSDFVLTDGTKITTTASELEIGVEVYHIDDQGNQTPLDNGDYVLNDGRTITVQDNKITNISGGETTEDESPVSDASASMESKMADGMAEKPADEGNLAQRVTDLEAQLEEVLNLLKKMSDGQTQVNQEMMSTIKKFSEEPGAMSIKTGKKGYEEYSSKKAQQKKNQNEIDEIRALIAERHKRDNNLAL